MSAQTQFPKQTILGVEVDRLSMAQAVDHIIAISHQKKCYYVVKPYVEYLDLAAKDSEVKNLLNQAYLSLPDGVSLNWATYFSQHTAGHWWDVTTSLAKIVLRPLELHLALPNYSWGTNFTWSLLQAAAKNGRTVYLVGSPKNNDIDETKKFLIRHIPSLQIIGAQPWRNHSGKFLTSLKTQLLTNLKKLRPDIVLVGIGFPAQDKLNAELQLQLNHGILIGEGGTFDFDTFGGHLPKAPTFMQHRGLEWLWRLWSEPSRWRRQLAIPRYIWRVYRQKR